ncbi:MAG: GNAT family N-acetyltransferase [Phycisphaerales bacterium]|nr:GNAT family N-acetyltransferase [Phycisphaerales bacterium]
MHSALHRTLPASLASSVPHERASEPSETERRAQSGADFDADEWNAFVAEALHGYHEQTYMYAMVRQNFGFACRHVFIRQAGRLVAGAQVLLRRTPIGLLAHVWRAPIAVEDQPELLDQAARAIDDAAREWRVASIRIDTLPTQDAARRALREQGFCPSDAWIGKKTSLVIPLVGSDDALLARIRRKTRYNMRIAAREGVDIRVEMTGKISEFYELYRQSAAHNGFVPFEQRYFEQIWRTFAPRGRAMMCTASLGDRPISMLLSMKCGERLYPSWIGTDRDALHRNLQVGGLLYYEAMRWGRDHGCSLLDFQDAMPYKRLYSDQELSWPVPMRKYYGPLRAARSRAVECSWSRPALRRSITAAAQRLGLRPRMPY